MISDPKEPVVWQIIYPDRPGWKERSMNFTLLKKEAESMEGAGERAIIVPLFRELPASLSEQELKVENNRLRAELNESVKFRDRCEILEERAEAYQKKKSVLVKALQFYADGEHFKPADQDEWKPINGEPTNFLFNDRLGHALIEDGSVAKQAIGASAELIDAWLKAYFAEWLKCVKPFGFISDACRYIFAQVGAGQSAHIFNDRDSVYRNPLYSIPKEGINHGSTKR